MKIIDVTFGKLRVIPQNDIKTSVAQTNALIYLI